jgi:hypothetical protein
VRPEEYKLYNAKTDRKENAGCTSSKMGRILASHDTYNSTW